MSILRQLTKPKNLQRLNKTWKGLSKKSSKSQLLAQKRRALINQRIRSAIPSRQQVLSTLKTGASKVKQGAISAHQKFSSLKIRPKTAIAWKHTKTLASKARPLIKKVGKANIAINAAVGGWQYSDYRKEGYTHSQALTKTALSIGGGIVGTTVGAGAGGLAAAPTLGASIPALALGGAYVGTEAAEKFADKAMGINDSKLAMQLKIRNARQAQNDDVRQKEEKDNG